MKLLTAIGAFSVAVILSSVPTFAQAAKAEPKVEGLKRTPEGKVDFTGTYEWPKYLPGAKRGRSSATTFDESVFPPLKPGGEPFIEPRTGDPRHDEPRDYCMPAGFPAGMLSGNAMQFFQTKDYLVMVHEFQRMTRIIPLDGRTHRTYVEPSFYGDPVGHWEGDTLVVETTNQNGLVWLDMEGNFTTPNIHVVEKFTMKDLNQIDYEATITDPTIYTRPWTIRGNLGRHDDKNYELMEFACHEGNRALANIMSAARAEEARRP